jgi:beta-lactamase class D
MSRPLITLLFAPVVFVACSPNNVTVDNSLQRYFDSAGVKGSFGFFDNGQGHFTIYNLSRYRDSLYQPAATFDILQSVIAIQSGVVKDDSSEILPGITLEQAFQSPSWIGKKEGQELWENNISRTLARRIGRDTLKKWIDSLQYGNKYMGGDPIEFWSNNSLKINSDQQLGLLKKLYFGQLPFFRRPQQIVCAMMTAESNSNYQLRYKTAQGIKEDGRAIGWIMGWVEENKHPYFFVVNLESTAPGKDLGKAGLAIAKSVLLQLGFFQGKK